MKKIVLLFLILLFPVVSNASKPYLENNFLVISDIHLDKAKIKPMVVSPDGGTKDNDLDEVTLNQLLDRIKTIENKPKFIIVLGDIVGHKRSQPTSVLDSETTVFKLLKTTFPEIPIFYIFGNNDSLSSNYGLFVDKTQKENTQSPYEIAIHKANWLNGFLSTGKFCKHGNEYPCLIMEDNQNGYYSAYIQPGFRLIAVNSILFSERRPPSAQDAAIQELKWLENQLQTAKELKERTLIAMHIPPGNNVFDHSLFWLANEQDSFLKMMNQYQDVIAGILVGHTHAEELKIIKNSDDNAIGAIYFTAALSTAHGNEPSIKQFYFSNNNNKWALTNYETFHFSEMGQGTITFESLYNYDAFYCSNSTNDMLDCINNVTVEKMKKYLSAGNKNFAGTIASPNDIYLRIPA